MDYSLCLISSTYQDLPKVHPDPSPENTQTHIYTKLEAHNFRICTDSRLLGDLKILNQSQGYINSPCWEQWLTIPPPNLRLRPIRRPTCCQSWRGQWQRLAGHTLGNYSPWWTRLLPHGQTASRCSQLERRRNHIPDLNDMYMLIYITVYYYWTV